MFNFYCARKAINGLWGCFSGPVGGEHSNAVFAEPRGARPHSETVDETLCHVIEFFQILPPLPLCRNVLCCCLRQHFQLLFMCTIDSRIAHLRCAVAVISITIIPT